MLFIEIYFPRAKKVRLLRKVPENLVLSTTNPKLSSRGVKAIEEEMVGTNGHRAWPRAKPRILEGSPSNLRGVLCTRGPPGES